MHHLLTRRLFTSDDFRFERRGGRSGETREQRGFVDAHRFRNPRTLRHETADDGHRMAARLREEGRLRAVEALGDRGEFVLERNGLVDRRDAAAPTQMCKPVTQGARRPDVVRRGAQGRHRRAFA